MVALARVHVLAARLQQAQLNFSEAQRTVHQSLQMCHKLLNSTMDEQNLPACTLLAVQRAVSACQTSDLCRAFQKITVSQDTTQLRQYPVNRIARVTRDALCTYSAILCEQKLETRMSVNCAIAAAKISRMCDSAATCSTVLVDHQVCVSMVQHIFKQIKSPLCMMSPWHCHIDAAAHFLNEQMSHALVDASPEVRRCLRLCWTNSPDSVLDSFERLGNLDCYCPEFVAYCNSVGHNVMEPHGGSILKWLANTCTQSAAISGIKFVGERLSLQLTSVYMSLFEVRCAACVNGVWVAHRNMIHRT